MKVTALTRTTRIGPSTRYRIEQYRPWLAEHDIQLECLPLFGPTWFVILELRWRPLRALAKAAYSMARLAARVLQARRAARGSADLVLVEQQLFPYLPWWLERALWPGRKPTVLEFDDAIYLTFAHRRKLERLCARADVVVVGNRFLEAFARPHARRVEVIPTTVDLGRAVPARPSDDGVLRVVWIGLRYNFGPLEMLARPLATLCREGLPCQLIIISSGMPRRSARWEGVPWVHRPWSEQGEAGDIAAGDVGVMPLHDDEWSRGKCALKLLQYMAAGLPVVASPVGVNADILQHDENGLLARDEAQWTECLRRLAADRGLRTRLGRSGRRTVEEGYSLESGARRVAETYRLAVPSADRGRGSGQHTVSDPAP